MIADEPLKRGRPPIGKIDLDVVRRSAGIGCTVGEIAAVLGLSRATLYNYMESNPEVQEAIDFGRENGRGTLRRMQWSGAESGNATMLIWLGKQLLGQREVTNVQQLDANGQPTNPTVTEYRWAEPPVVPTSDRETKR